MTGVFIKLHSRVIDFSTLSFLFLNENLPQYHIIYHKKLSKASGSFNRIQNIFKCHPSILILCPRVLIPTTERLIKPRPYRILRKNRELF